MVKGARQREWPRHLSTHTHTHWTLPTTMSVLETPFDIHVSSVYQTHTCMQAPIPTLCISAKKTHNKGSRTRPIMSTLMPRSGIPVICSRATLSCDSSYCTCRRPRYQVSVNRTIGPLVFLRFALKMNFGTHYHLIEAVLISTHYLFLSKNTENITFSMALFHSCIKLQYIQ